MRDDRRGALELLFDLCLVVAAAQAAAGLDHAFVENHVGSGMLTFLLMSSHLVGVDEPDLVRLGLRHRRRALPAAVMVQICGALVMAAGYPGVRRR